MSLICTKANNDHISTTQNSLFLRTDYTAPSIFTLVLITLQTAFTIEIIPRAI